MRSLKLHYDMSDSDYFDYPAASNSLLTQLKRSPAHLMEAIKNPAPPTPAMRLGSAFHVATLEPEKFDKFCSTAWIRTALRLIEDIFSL